MELNLYPTMVTLLTPGETLIGIFPIRMQLSSFCIADSNRLTVHLPKEIPTPAAQRFKGQNFPRLIQYARPRLNTKVFNFGPEEIAQISDAYRGNPRIYGPFQLPEYSWGRSRYLRKYKVT